MKKVLFAVLLFCITPSLNCKERSVEEVLVKLKSYFGIEVSIPNGWQCESFGVGFRGNDYKRLLDDFYEVVAFDTSNSCCVLMSSICLTDKSSAFCKNQLRDQLKRTLGILDEDGNVLSLDSYSDGDYVTEISGAILKINNIDTILFARIPLERSHFVVLKGRSKQNVVKSLENHIQEFTHMYKCELYSAKTTVSFAALFKDSNQLTHLQRIIEIAGWYHMNNKEHPSCSASAVWPTSSPGAS